MLPLDIIFKTCEVFGLTYEEIIPTKPKEQQGLMQVTCRQLCVYYICKYHPYLTLKVVSMFFNKDTHCFALNARNAARDYIKTQDDLLYPYYLELNLIFNS